MADTTYIDFVQPAVSAEWLNEINDHVWHDTPIAGATVHNAASIAVTPFENIAATNVQDALNEIVTDLSSTIGSSLVGYKQPDVNSIAVTVNTKLQESISVLDFGAVGDGIVDDTDAIQLAVDSNRTIFFPEGTYRITSPCIFSNKSNFALIGAGKGVSVIKCDAGASFTNSATAFVTCDHFKVSGLTFDQNNNISFTGSHVLLFAVSSTNFEIVDNEIVHYTYIAVGADSCQNFWVERNYIERDTAINTTNYAINVSSSVTTSLNGHITGNTCIRSGSIYKGSSISIINNKFSDYKYGAGVTTVGDSISTYYGYVVSNNNCTNGAGIDVDGIYVAGMEISGSYSSISNNICIGNSGVGIATFAWRSTFTGNTCLGNGVGGGADKYRSGILLGYAGSVTESASYCSFVGNHCADIGGTTQLYGFYEDSTLLVGNNVAGNKFSGNITANEFFQGTLGYYETNGWYSYTPTLTAQTGTITTVGTVSGLYKTIGKTVFVRIRGSITTNGTGGTGIEMTLPSIPGLVSGGNHYGTGREDGITGKQLLAKFVTGTDKCRVTFYDATYPGANGAVIEVSGVYSVS